MALSNKTKSQLIVGLIIIGSLLMGYSILFAIIWREVYCPGFCPNPCHSGEHQHTCGYSCGGQTLSCCYSYSSCSNWFCCYGDPVYKWCYCHDDGGGGGGGCTPNCGCASSTCQGQTCSDGCGGTCAGTMYCCEPEPSSETCAGYDCGYQENNCGDQVLCGSCGDNQYCSSGQCLDYHECEEDGCDGYLFYTCSETYEKSTPTAVIGQCGVECIDTVHNQCNENHHYMTCSNYQITDQGIILGQCGVECTGTSCNGREYLGCSSAYKIQHLGLVGAKCGVECTENNLLGGYYCYNNQWMTLVDYENRTNLPKSYYYRFENNSCSLINIYPLDLTDYDYGTLQECQENYKNNISFTAVYTQANQTIVIPPAPGATNIPGIIVILVLVAGGVYITLRRIKR